MNRTSGGLNRRTFVQLTAAAALAAASRKLIAGIAAPTLSSTDGSIKVVGAHYSWEYSRDSDRFTLRDSRDRMIVTGKVQPAVVVSAADGSNATPVSSPGAPSGHRVDGSRIVFDYEKVNGEARLSVAWRFDEQGIWTEPVIYESPSLQDVISLHYFADGGETRQPNLYATYVVVPGALTGSTVSPIINQNAHLHESVWLGRGSFLMPGLMQQWGLPVHYFCGFSTLAHDGERKMDTEGRADAFTCGLADLPTGDFYLQMNEGKVSPWIDYRSDLWKHLRGPGKLTLGATFLWSIAPDYYEAIAGYYEGLLQAGVIQRKRNSARKTETLLMPEFCTWGAQVAEGKGGDKLDEAWLDQIYQDLKASGMKAGLFSIDDKWEGTYGKLEHSAERLPHFEGFLARLRADGMRIGMWAAVMRCERPADLGLTENHMLKRPDGTAFRSEFAKPGYYILDFTQPEAAAAMTEVVRRFIRRYKPDLFKFDFGYELPSLAVAAPQDKKWAGERLMWKGLEVIVKAMREENPDLVVMYYNLSPLFLDYIDLHSPDDLFLDVGDFEVEANRRIFFSSLMGRLGVPTYGSTGYDWSSSPSIWFDSAAVGTIGCLNDFRGDPEGESGNPGYIAKYNGIAQALRPTSVFQIVPLGNVSIAPTRGAHARSWARFEGGQLVLMAYRPVPPGEDYPLADHVSDPRLKDVVRSTCPVVVSAKGSDGIATAANLVVVPYASGEISVRRDQGRRAEIVSHYFGGAVINSHASIEKGFVTLTASYANSQGRPLEWMEVKIT